MRYTVVWTPVAEGELAAVWAATADREAVTRAAYQLDQRLAEGAGDEGESRPDDRRIVHELPLGVTIRVDEPGRTVLVLKVWEVRSRRRG